VCSSDLFRFKQNKNPHIIAATFFIFSSLKSAYYIITK
jgi:hypothetical protein